MLGHKQLVRLLDGVAKLDWAALSIGRQGLGRLQRRRERETVDGTGHSRSNTDGVQRSFGTIGLWRGRAAQSGAGRSGSRWWPAGGSDSRQVAGREAVGEGGLRVERLRWLR